MVAQDERVLKISVKGSQDGSWGLTQTQLKKVGDANYHAAADLWLARHKPRTALCLVQFKGVMVDELPRIYLAWPIEVVEKLKLASNKRGDTILYEDYVRGPKAHGSGLREYLPEQWKLTRERIEEMLSSHNLGSSVSAVGGT